MKTRILIVASLAMWLTACEMNIILEPIPVDPPINDSIPTDTIPNDSIPNDSIISEPVPSPDDLALAQQLIGVWNTAPTNNYFCRSLFFSKHGQLVDRGEVTKLTWQMIRPKPRQFVYSVQNGKLIYNNDTTSFHLENDILTIDSFWISSNEKVSLVLKKAYEVPAVPLCQESIEKLDALYSFDTQQSFAGGIYIDNCVIAPTGEPCNSVKIPEFDYNKHILVLYRITLYRKEGLDVGFYYNQDLEYYEFVGEAQKALEGETMTMPYGIFDIPCWGLDYHGPMTACPYVQLPGFIYAY